MEPGNGPVINSYTEAYVSKSYNSPGYSGSRASTEERYYAEAKRAANLLRASMKQPPGSPLPAKSVSILHRPIKVSCKNEENLDRQHKKDEEAFERRANTYRRLSTQPYHHNKPDGSVLTLWEQGYIVDKGRGKTVTPSSGVANPITMQPAGDAGGSSKGPARPTSAPHQRTYASIHAAAQQQQQQHSNHTRPESPSLEHKRLQAARGHYNPLTHQYKQAPDDKYVEQKAREFERATGTNRGLRKLDDGSAVFDPISGEYKTRPVSAQRVQTQARTAAAGSAAATQPTATTPESTPLAGAGAAGGAGAEGGWSGGDGGDSGMPVSPAVPMSHSPSPVPPRPGSTGRMRHVHMQGESWGTLNPISGEWRVPPRDPRYMDQEGQVERRLGATGASLARSPSPHGVYNPILNTWVVPPANPRVAEGLTFSPATLFSRPTPATLRM